MKYILATLFLFFYLHGQSQAIDQASSLVTFEISNFGFRTVEGAIGNIDGTIDFDAGNTDLCRFDVCIDVSTIDTDNEERDAHLLREDFFDVANYPNICFYSEDVVKTAAGYAVTGNLTMKGVEKIVTIHFTYSDLTFSGTLSVDRLDYGIGPNGGFMVGSEADISILVKTF